MLNSQGRFLGSIANGVAPRLGLSQEKLTEAAWAVSLLLDHRVSVNPVEQQP